MAAIEAGIATLIEVAIAVFSPWTPNISCHQSSVQHVKCATCRSWPFSTLKENTIITKMGLAR